MSNAEKCCVCGNKFNGLFKADKPSDAAVQALNHLGYNVEDYCIQCYVKKVAEVDHNIEQLIIGLRQDLEKATEKELEKIQVLTTIPPYDWKFEVKGIVSGYSVIGTGPLTEIASAFTDLFGQESVAYNEKIRTGEARAINIAKMEALKKGANVLSGVNLNVSEATRGNGMLIISCVGTAINTPNGNQEKSLLPKFSQELKELQDKLRTLRTTCSV